MIGITEYLVIILYPFAASLALKPRQKEKCLGQNECIKKIENPLNFYHFKKKFKDSNQKQKYVHHKNSGPALTKRKSQKRANLSSLCFKISKQCTHLVRNRSRKIANRQQHQRKQRREAENSPKNRSLFFALLFAKLFCFDPFPLELRTGPNEIK